MARRRSRNSYFSPICRYGPGFNDTVGKGEGILFFKLENKVTHDDANESLSVKLLQKRLTR